MSPFTDGYRNSMLVIVFIVKSGVNHVIFHLHKNGLFMQGIPISFIHVNEFQLSTQQKKECTVVSCQ